MITFNQLMANSQNPELANYSITEQHQYRQQQFMDFKQSPQYYMMSSMDRTAAERNFMSNDFIGYSPEELEAKGNVRAADYARQLQSVKSGSVVPLDTLDGFIDTFKNSLTGKIAIGVGNFVSQGNLTEHIYDDEIAKQLRDVRDESFSAYDVDGITDYKIGKGLGFVAGIAADMFGTAKVYGAVAAPGLLMKPLTGKGVSKLLSSAHNFTAKEMATKMTPYWFGQMVGETVGFQIEEGIADLVTGKMDQDGGFNNWLKTNYKSNLARGFGYFLMGETLGLGVNKMLKTYGKTFTGKGYRSETIQRIQKMNYDEQMDYLSNIITKPELGKNEIEVLRAIDTDLLKKVQKTKRELKFLETLEDPNSQFAYTFSRNFDADMEVKDTGEFVLKSLRDQEINKTFKDRNEFLSYVSKTDKELRNKLFDSSFNQYKDNVGGFKLSLRGKGEVKSVNGTFSSVTKTFAPNDFRVRADNIKNFVDEVKLQGDSEQAFNVVLKQDFFTNPPKAQKGIIYAPTVIDDASKQKEFLKSFKVQMKENFELTSLRDVNLTNYLENLGTYNKYTTSWMEQVLGEGRVVKQGNQILVNTPDGSVKNFSSETEAGRYVHSLMLDENLLNRHLANEHGLKLKVEEDGSYSVLGTNKNKTAVVTNAESIPTLLTNNPEYLPKKPIETAPFYMKFTNGQANIDKQIAQGSFKKMTDKMKEYGQIDQLFKSDNQIKTNGWTINFKDATSQYNVKLINGLERDFESLSQAKKWANQDWDSMKTRIEDLEEFGYKVYANEAGYLVKDLQGNSYPIRDRDGLLEFMKNNQAIERTAPLDGFDPDNSFNIGARIKEEANMMRDAIYKKGAQQKARASKQFLWSEKLGKLMLPVKQSAAKYGYKQDVDPLITDYLAANRVFEQKDTQTKAWVSSIFDKFNTYEKETMGKIMMQEKAFDPQTFAEALTKYDLDGADPKYFELYSQSREFFNRMGVVAGVDTGDFIPNYLPRFLDVNMSDVINKDMTDARIYDQYFKGKIPANMDPFMRKMRKTDIARMQEVNLQQVMNSYAEIAWRSQYLEGFDARTGSLIDKLQTENANSDLIVQLKAFKERMVGRSYDKDAVALAQQHEHNKMNAERILSNDFLKKVLNEQQRTEVAGWAKRSNPVSGAKALMTSALMSFKMRMPVRNMAQIWTHLGAIYDNPEILRAFRQVSDNPEFLYKEMMERGITNPRQGRNSGQLMSWLRDANQVGLNWHQNSDDFTRMIGYQASKTRFNVAYNKLKSGEVDLEGFHKVAGSWALDDVDKLKINNFMQEGRFVDAETVLTSRVVEKCFFDYSSAAKPLAQNNAVANIFMQYSTYPLQTIQLWKNAFGSTLKTDPKQAMASLGRVSANIAGLSVLFSELIGYSNTPTSFFEYMMFTGGPAAQSLSDSVSIAGSNDSVVNKGKRIVDANKATFTPFYGVSKATRRSIQSLVEGEEIMAIQYALGGTGQEQDSILDLFQN